METPDAPIDIVGIRRGCIGAVVGVDDWDVSRMGEATEMVVYDFGTRRGAHQAIPGLRLATDIRLADVDGLFAPSCTVVLGQGIGPAAVNYPYKFRVVSPGGFRSDPMKVFDAVVDIIRRGAWDEHPGYKAVREASPAEAPERVGRAGEGETALRLGAAPRMPVEGALARTCSMPAFRVYVPGFMRPIRPTSYGKDADGNRVLGETHVKGHWRWKDQPLPPDAAEREAGLNRRR